MANNRPQTFKSEFLTRLSERGYIKDCTDYSGLDARLTEMGGEAAAYIGFDATADSLHVGSLLQIMMLHHFQAAGHRPISLMGGGTPKIGDPSGKDATRQMLTLKLIEQNIQGILKPFAKLLNYEGQAILANNADWLEKLGYVELLRTVGPHFTLNRMLTFESVKSRLDREQPLTFLEFNYMILQAYDFMELNRRHNCILQMGGSDQWGNIVAGVELTRRLSGHQVFGLTAPLLTTASGAKMGKSVGGAVWLNEERLPAFDFYQYWRNTEDADVGRFLKLFTLLPLDEIARLTALQGQEINEAKALLAFEVTKLVRGQTAALGAAEAAKAQFAGTDGIKALPTKALTLPPEGLVIDLFAAGFGLSKSDARRLIQGGGAKLNDEKIDSLEASYGPDALMHAGKAKLSSGKKRHILVTYG